jgi:Tripartite tricarboxylate transporter family receptor
LPTVDEAGVPGYEYYTWFGLWAPKGTPQAIVEKMYTEVQKALAMPGGSCIRLWKVSSDGAAAASTTPWSRQSQRFFPREPSEIQYRIRFS